MQVKNEEKEVVTKWVCACGASEDKPWCDGSHSHLSDAQSKALDAAVNAYSAKQTKQKLLTWAFYGAIAAVGAFVGWKAYQHVNKKK